MKVVSVSAALLFALIVTSISIQYNDTRTFVPRFFQETPDETPSRDVTIGKTALLYLAMLAGIVAGQTYVNLTPPNGPAPGEFWKTLRNAALTPQLLRGLLASPIVFAVVYALAERHPDRIMATMFAFENGFFWHVVLRERASARGGTQQGIGAEPIQENDDDDVRGQGTE